MCARKRAYDVGCIFEPPEAVHALSFHLEQKKQQKILFSAYTTVLSLVAAWTHLVRVSERTDLRCIALNYRRLPRVQKLCDPHSRQRKET
jgi:hypothetical protein